jgi:DNA-binding NarL/FixJ family response regulator
VEVNGINADAVHQGPDGLLDHVRDGPPDVVVLDLALVETERLRRLLADIRDAAPRTRILLLADELDRASVRAARDEDVDGLVLKSASAAELSSAVRQVAAGSQVFPDGFLAAVRGVDVGPEALSARQREVLELLADGLSNECIAERLVISTNTVRFHVREIYHRLNVHNRVQAARVLAEERVPA